MSFADAFLSMAGAFPEVFRDAEVIAQRKPIVDDGGSIVAPVAPLKSPCKAQGDVATREMRADADFVQGDIRLMLLGATSIDASMRVMIPTGPHAGLYEIRSATRDSAGIGWECRGRLCP